jgi:hypothetical protein
LTVVWRDHDGCDSSEIDATLAVSSEVTADEQSRF